MEISAVLVPCIFIILGILTVFRVKSGLYNSKYLVEDNIPCNYLTETNNGCSRVFTNWGPVKIENPPDWNYSFTQRIGGKTLTFAPPHDCDTGIHIQLCRIDDTLNFKTENNHYLNKSGLTCLNWSDSLIGGINANICETSYTADNFIQMRAKLVFLKKNRYLLKLIYFSPENRFLKHEPVFKSVMDSIRFS